MWWLSTHWNHSSQFLLWGVAISASLIGAITDMRMRRIPNWLTGSVFASGVAWSALNHGGPGLADSGLGCLAMMLLFVLLFIVAGGGAGDAKLMGALGIWLGVINGLFALGGVLLAGGVLALAQSIANRRLGLVFRNIGYIFVKLAWVLIGRGRYTTMADVHLEDEQTAGKIPYGIGIFAGVCLAATGVSIWRSALT